MDQSFTLQDLQYGCRQKLHFVDNLKNSEVQNEIYICNAQLKDDCSELSKLIANCSLNRGISNMDKENILMEDKKQFLENEIEETQRKLDHTMNEIELQTRNDSFKWIISMAILSVEERNVFRSIYKIKNSEDKQLIDNKATENLNITNEDDRPKLFQNDNDKVSVSSRNTTRKSKNIEPLKEDNEGLRLNIDTIQKLLQNSSVLSQPSTLSFLECDGEVNGNKNNVPMFSDLVSRDTDNKEKIQDYDNIAVNYNHGKDTCLTEFFASSPEKNNSQELKNYGNTDMSSPNNCSLRIDEEFNFDTTNLPDSKIKNVNYTMLNTTLDNDLNVEKSKLVDVKGKVTEDNLEDMPITDNFMDNTTNFLPFQSSKNTNDGSEFSINFNSPECETEMDINFDEEINFDCKEDVFGDNMDFRFE
uniref:Uncharacterized protein n=1 Tax=Parastrongyloides trichosuri TaxID=131310 RepID=A0A0N4ZRS2_PARTI